MITLNTGAATSGTRGFVGYLSTTGASARSRGGAVYIQVGDKHETDASVEATLSDGAGAVAEPAEKRGPPLIPGGLISPDGRTVQMTYYGGGTPSKDAHNSAGAPAFYAGMLIMSTGAASTGNYGYIGLARSTLPPQPGDVMLQLGDGHITNDRADGSADFPESISIIDATKDRPAVEIAVLIERSGELIAVPISEHPHPVGGGAIRIKERNNAEVDRSVRLVEYPHNVFAKSQHAGEAPFETVKKPVQVGVLERVAQWVSSSFASLARR